MIGGFKRVLAQFLGIPPKVVKVEIASIENAKILENKRIIVTGGGTGIGLAIAHKFILCGAEVLICGRNEDKLRDAVANISSKKMKYIVWDVSDVSIQKEKLSEAISILGGLDILVNNAGFVEHRRWDEAYFDKNMQTNVKALYYMCLNAIDFFMSRNEMNEIKKIINISSLISFRTNSNPYTIAKKAVNAITEGFAKEYANYNILINAIAPGYTSASINKIDTDKNAYDTRCPLDRIIMPEEIAEIASFIASNAANGIVGQVITCDGGATL